MYRVRVKVEIESAGPIAPDEHEHTGQGEAERVVATMREVEEFLVAVAAAFSGLLAPDSQMRVYRTDGLTENRDG